MCAPCRARASTRGATMPSNVINGRVRPVSPNVNNSRSGGKAAEVLRKRTLWTGRG